MKIKEESFKCEGMREGRSNNAALFVLSTSDL